MNTVLYCIVLFPYQYRMSCMCNVLIGMYTVGMSLGCNHFVGCYGPIRSSYLMFTSTMRFEICAFLYLVANQLSTIFGTNALYARVQYQNHSAIIVVIALWRCLVHFSTRYNINPYATT